MAESQRNRVVNVGTRKSPLALAQTQIVVDALKKNFPDHEFNIHSMTTTGDRDQNTALYNFGGKGLWTSQLEEKLVNKELDIVVHSLKDMPTVLPEGCVLGCVTSREDPRDTLVIKKELQDKHGWKTLADLPDGSIIGTSSVRRIAQLIRRYPTLKFKDHRGNIQTQSDNGGILHAVGQGALGVECRADDEEVIRLLKTIENEQTALACEAERALMRALEGGCSVPIGVETKWVDDKLHMKATVVNLRGDHGVDSDITEAVKTHEEADKFGRKLANALVERGGGSILDEITRLRQVPETVK
ncbi:Uncharacterized protein Y057_15006 [Fusarium fujikuroi]|nr:Uncharacterized protein Y057_15006 [Fusarium fujikuroi]